MAIAAESAPAPGRLAVLILALTAFAVVVLSGPPIPQDAAYHHMADTKPVLGIANGLNVVSNVPFALAGIFGLVEVFRRRGGEVEDHDERRLGPYVVLFGGTALTALGSGYYHLAPDNARLVWDRLPMTFVCAGLLTVVLAGCVSARAARRLFCPSSPLRQRASAIGDGPSFKEPAIYGRTCSSSTGPSLRSLSCSSCSAAASAVSRT